MSLCKDVQWCYQTLRITIATRKWKKAITLDLVKTGVVAQNNYNAVIEAMLWIPTEMIYWNNYKTFGKYQLFAHQNM